MGTIFVIITYNVLIPAGHQTKVYKHESPSISKQVPNVNIIIYYYYCHHHYLL